MTTTSDPAVRAYVDEHAAAFFDELADWLRIPSIGADPKHDTDVRRSADWLAAALRRTGFPIVELWETPGHPTVFAEWPSDDDDAPTVVVYGHHDVQPVDPEELWHSPPFEPTVRGEEMFGRGTADDKGQVLFHLLGLRAHLTTTGRSTPAVTLKLLIEGEEESGSTHFPALLRERRDRLRCDVVVVSDTGVWSRDVPATCTGMRGMVDLEIHVHGPDGDLHSGSFGGAVPNPTHVLADLLAGLHDADGRVTLPGFYDDVRPLSQRERDLFALLHFDEQEWLRTAESRATYGERGFSTLERIWARPTLEVNGMWGGYLGPGMKSIVPSDAHAKVSCRLVADQDCDVVTASLRSYVADRTPDGIQATVVAGVGVPPFLVSLDDPALRAVQAAMATAFETDVLFTREGGSGPEGVIAQVLDVPVVFLGVGLPDDRIHAPNERVVMPMLLRGAEAAAYLWSELPAALQ